MRRQHAVGAAGCGDVSLWKDESIFIGSEGKPGLAAEDAGGIDEVCSCPTPYTGVLSQCCRIGMRAGCFGRYTCKTDGAVTRANPILILWTGVPARLLHRSQRTTMVANATYHASLHIHTQPQQVQQAKDSNVQ